MKFFNLFLLQMQRLPHGALVLKITTHLVRFISRYMHERRLMVVGLSVRTKSAYTQTQARAQYFIYSLYFIRYMLCVFNIRIITISLRALYTVDALKKDCKYVDLSLIPRPVISLFTRLKQRRGPIPTPHSGAKVDWSRIEPKLSGTLMHFQREGVE